MGDMGKWLRHSSTPCHYRQAEISAPSWNVVVDVMIINAISARWSMSFAIEARFACLGFPSLGPLVL